MIKATYQCDFCSKEITMSSQGHAGASRAVSSTSYKDSLTAPREWIVVGTNILCQECQLSIYAKLTASPVFEDMQRIAASVKEA